jgi:tricorn protease
MRGLTLSIIIFVTFFMIYPTYAATEVKSMSFPAISADGKTVYFTAWGDIWSAPCDGRAPARRLTDNVAYEARPTLSPDGNTIAFLSDRFGNYDIFTMPEEGGKATRLTWDANVDYPYDWKPDGTAILTYTLRQDQWGQCAYEIKLDGSQPARITGPDFDEHVFPSYLGDEKKIIYTRGPGDWAKPGWVGSNTYDLWIYDTETKTHSTLTNNDIPDLWPQPSPDGSVVYFTRTTDDTYNLWSYTFKSNEFKQLTSFKKDGVLWPRISSDGDEIVFEIKGEIYYYDINSMKTGKIPIRFSDDLKHDMVADEDIVNQVTEYAVSPNGKYYAVVVMGDIFILKNQDIYKEEEKPDQDLTRAFHVVDSPGRDFQVAWHPKDMKIAYVSDRDGQFDLYILDLATLIETKITDTKVDEWNPIFAPHGNKLAYYSGNRKLRLYDTETKKDELLYEGQLIQGPWILGYEWSPDGKWIAFSEGIRDSISNVFIVNIEDKKPFNVSFEPDYSSSPSWSPDGKYLAFHVYYEEGSEVMLLELDPEKEIYDLDLLFPDDKPKEPEVKEEKKEDVKIESAGEEKKEEQKPDVKSEEKPASTAEGEKKEEEKKEEEVKPVVINFDRIRYRARPIVKLNANAYSPKFAPTSDYLIFVTDHEGEDAWWSINIDGEELNKLGSAITKDYPQFSTDGKKLYFLEGGRMTYMDMAGAKSSGGGAVAVKSRMTVDQYQVWDQMLVEGWRRLRDGFYDANMKGVDWNDVLARYRPRIKDLGTMQEYNALYRLMLGELKASHLAFYSNETGQELPSDNTADFGVLFDETWNGDGWKIKKVYMDSPAKMPGSELYVGDIILKVNDKSVKSSDNREMVLRNLAGIPVKLKVLNGENFPVEKKEGGDSKSEVEKKSPEREVVIKPVASIQMGTIKYDDWAEENRKYVYEKSDNRIGYQHIRSMYGGPFLNKFRRDLFTESMDKEALIIDVRFNGGGSIAHEILNILRQDPYYRHQLRDSKPGQRPPLFWKGPIVLLMNADSFSNAEIFGHIMREFKMATIIGETTGGGVISTYDFTLMDGSTFRMPAWKNSRLDGTDMEGNGVVPDIYVHIDPNLTAEGKDNQLDAAIDYLLKEIGKN